MDVDVDVIIEAVRIIRKGVVAKEGAYILREQLKLIMYYAKRIKGE